MRCSTRSSTIRSRARTRVLTASTRRDDTWRGLVVTVVGPREWTSIPPRGWTREETVERGKYVVCARGSWLPAVSVADAVAICEPASALANETFALNGERLLQIYGARGACTLSRYTVIFLAVARASSTILCLPTRTSCLGQQPGRPLLCILKPLAPPFACAQCVRSRTRITFVTFLHRYIDNTVSRISNRRLKLETFGWDNDKWIRVSYFRNQNH